MQLHRHHQICQVRTRWSGAGHDSAAMRKLVDRRQIPLCDGRWRRLTVRTCPGNLVCEKCTKKCIESPLILLRKRQSGRLLAGVGEISISGDENSNSWVAVVKDCKKHGNADPKGTPDEYEQCLVAGEIKMYACGKCCQERRKELHNYLIDSRGYSDVILWLTLLDTFAHDD